MSGVSGSGRAVSPSRCGGSNAATRPVDAGPSPRHPCPSPHRAPGERNGLAWRRPGSASPAVRVSSRIRPTLRARAHSVGVGSGCTEPDAIAGSLRGGQPPTGRRGAVARDRPCHARDSRNTCAFEPLPLVALRGAAHQLRLPDEEVDSVVERVSAEDGNRGGSPRTRRNWWQARARCRGPG